MTNRVLSGMRPTGDLHLGNYFGAIKQFLDLQARGVECFFFAADIHALTEVKGPTTVAKSSLEVVKNYLACGIDPNKSVLYRQSNIPEISEISLLLSNIANMAELRRCTTYKGKYAAAVVQALIQTKMKKDDAIQIVKKRKEHEHLPLEVIRRCENKFSHGLLGYPVLMASDILCVRATTVPVGEDQVQHVEMAQDLAKAFNRMFKSDAFVIPELNINNPIRVRGIDGDEKMGKSDNNAIALLEDPSDIKKKVFSIKTQTKTGGAKEPGTESLFNLMELCSAGDVHTEYLKKFAAGEEKFFGEMKQQLTDDIIALVEPIQERYHQLSDDDVRDVLAQGVATVRPIAQDVLGRMKDAMGL